MASPRAAFSVLQHLSPRRIQQVSSIRQALSPKCPKTPVRNTLTVDSVFQNHPSPRFNIDTPNRKKIINEGLLGGQQTVLGHGAFGTVYKASYKGEDVAAKVIKSNNNTKKCSKNMEREAVSLRHLNVVKVLMVHEGPALTLITMELCSKSLDDMLEDHSIAKEKRIYIWESIAEALKYCHSKGVVHADVKPKNVLMGTDDQPKLADFGSAVIVHESDTPLTFHGTPGYAAPEIVRGNLPTPLSDIYSLGILAWQMLSRTAPFADLHKHTILYLTGKGTTPPDSDLDDDFNGKYKDLYKKCWNKMPENRPSLDVITKKLKEL
ncbi:serine/threonine-protein kinase mos-like [Copidosoma floridanum]|uniref:serine/threonine-protein kinase mos-like n=1 Tax=Copidosoma floridanum TaxID=29053 RepID=UPI0006C962D2|nr:serine/threonine-protein kinase mos-like [Copidosoma floridanum]